jgi:hypothetical protein
MSSASLVIISYILSLLLQRSLQTWRTPLEEQFKVDSKLYLSLFREVKQRMAEGKAHECQCTRAWRGRDEFKSGLKVSTLSVRFHRMRTFCHQAGIELEEEKDREFGTEMEMAFGVSAAFSAGIDTVRT